MGRGGRKGERGVLKGGEKEKEEGKEEIAVAIRHSMR